MLLFYSIQSLYNFTGVLTMSMPFDNQLFQQAVALAQAGQREQANNILAQILQSPTNDPNVWLWYAFTTNDMAMAREAIRRAEMLQPELPAVTQAKGWLAQQEAQQTPPAPQYSYQQVPPGVQEGYEQGWQNQRFQQPQQTYQESAAYQQYQGGGTYQNVPVYFREKPDYFDRFSLGWAFLKQTFGMLKTDNNLIKPGFYSLLCNLVASIILAIPMFFIYRSARDNNVILYVSLFLVAVVNYFITYYFSGATIHLVYQNLTKGQSDLKEAWKVTGQRAGQILTVAAISAFISTIRQFANRRGGGVFGIAASIALWIVNSIWTVYTFFVLPLIVVENMSVGASVKRSTYIIKNNLLLIGVSYIGIGLVVGLISFVVFIIAALGSVLLFLTLYKISTIVAFVVALLVFVLVLALLSAFSSYVRTAYYTCMVMWAQSVEKQGAVAIPPAPLRRVLDRRVTA